MENSLKNWKKSGRYVFSAQRFIDAEFEQARKNNCTFWLATATPESVIQKYRWILSADGKEVELDSSGFGQIPDPRSDHKGCTMFLSGRDCVDQADFAPYSGPIPPEPTKETCLTNQVYRALKDLGFIPEDADSNPDYFEAVGDELGKIYGKGEGRKAGRPRKSRTNLDGINSRLVYDEPSNPFSVDALRQEKDREYAEAHFDEEDDDLPF